MNLKVISYVVGWALNIEAGCMLLPFLCALAYGEVNKFLFLFCALLCLVVGLSLTVKPPKNKAIFAKEGFVAVALSWIIISIFYI